MENSSLAKLINIVDTLADLRNKPIIDGGVALVLGRNSTTDGLGGTYQWMDSVTDAEDLVNYNIIISNMSPTGRWVKTVQNNIQVPNGWLIKIGLFKIYISLKTTTNSDVVFYFTSDGTSAGTPLIDNVIFPVAIPLGSYTNANDAVVPYKKAQDSKSITYGFSRGNLVALNLSVVTSGINVLGIRDVPNGTSVGVFIFGT